MDTAHEVAEEIAFSLNRDCLGDLDKADVSGDSVKLSLDNGDLVYVIVVRRMT